MSFTMRKTLSGSIISTLRLFSHMLICKNYTLCNNIYYKVELLLMYNVEVHFPFKVCHFGRSVLSKINMQ